MKSLINLKTQFGQVLSRAELKGIIGGQRQPNEECHVDCSGITMTLMCSGSDCVAINDLGAYCILADHEIPPNWWTDPEHPGLIRCPII